MTTTIYTLENDYLEIKIKDIGAELCSLFNKKSGLEYIWQAGAAWPKHAPVLFPIVGQLKDNTYHYKNKAYQMDRHGFARTKIFSLEEKDTEKISFALCDDKQTQKQYPFHFKLSIQYELSENTLLIRYIVKNTDTENIYFSIGAHPAFKVPLFEEENFSDYFLLFEKDETASRHLLQNGLLDKKEKMVLNNEHLLPLFKNLFYDDAMVFKNLKSEIISIQSNYTHHGLHFLFKGFPYFGIWGAKDADFICLEPWHGVADHVDHDQDLEKKEGIISLGSGEEFSCFYSIVTY